MRILVFSLYFQPDPTGTGLILGELTRDLAKRGHDVTVVTTVTHYGLEGPVAGYRGRLIFDETWEDVRVLRTALPRFARSPRVRRLVTYLAYTLLAIPAGLRALRPDVVLGLLPPISTGPAVWLVSRLRRAPMVLSVQDVYPDSVFGGGLPARLNHALERFVLGRAARLITLSRGQRDALVARGVSAERIDVVPMWTDLEGVRPGSRNNPFRTEHGKGAALVALYAGNLGELSGVNVLLDAAHLLRNDTRIRFLIVGRGHGLAELTHRAARLELPNLSFLPTQPRERLAEMLAAADVGLVTLDPKLAATSVPSKTFTIMAAGRPVLAAVHPDNEVAQMVVAAQCGVIAPPDDPVAISAILRAWADDGSPLDAMGSRARSWAERFHGRGSAVQTHEDILASESRSARRQTGPDPLAETRPE